MYIMCTNCSDVQIINCTIICTVLLHVLYKLSVFYKSLYIIRLNIHSVQTQSLFKSTDICCGHNFWYKPKHINI